MAQRRQKGGHSTGARPRNVDAVSPDEVVTDADTAEETPEPESATTKKPAATGAGSGNVFDAARNAVVTVTDLKPPQVHRGPAVAKRDMYDHGGPRGGLRLVARAGQRIPAWYRGKPSGDK